MTVLVLGLGNILLSDEGVGVRVAEAFQNRYFLPEGVEVVDGGTVGIDLLDILGGRDHVIVLDAVRTGNLPGTVVRLDSNQVPALSRPRLSPHQLGLPEVLALLKVLESAPAGLILIGIEPADLSVGLDLSPTVAAKMDDMVEMVAAELIRLGFPMRPAPNAVESR